MNEWGIFACGVALGAGGTLFFSLVLVFWWMRPYLKEARKKSREAVNITAADLWKSGWTKKEAPGGEK
mgnify:CR=1 FL=1|tara:strand:+ start:70 stop:273 length:204 start_codon:yes stop_codon:yes gene_type:complete